MSKIEDGKFYVVDVTSRGIVHGRCYAPATYYHVPAEHARALQAAHVGKVKSEGNDGGAALNELPMMVGLDADQLANLGAPVVEPKLPVQAVSPAIQPSPPLEPAPTSPVTVETATAIKVPEPGASFAFSADEEVSPPTPEERDQIRALTGNLDTTIPGYEFLMLSGVKTYDDLLKTVPVDLVKLSGITTDTVGAIQRFLAKKVRAS